MSLINFKKLELLMKEDNTETLYSQYKQVSERLYDEDKIDDLNTLCLTYLDKYQSESMNKELINKINYDLVKTSNMLILSKLSSKTSKIDSIKKYIDICDNTPIGDYYLYMTTLNNKCCYFSRLNYHRNSIDIMTALREIYSLGSILEYNSTNLSNSNNSNIANTNLQLCAFQSQMKDYNEALLSGLQSLALNQLNLVHKVIGKRVKNTRKNESLSSNSKETSEISTNSMSVMLSYYNIGVQQEFLKRVSEIFN